MMLGGAIVISAMEFNHQQQRLWLETSRIALETGQPLPPAVAENFDSPPKPSAAFVVPAHA